MIGSAWFATLWMLLPVAADEAAPTLQSSPEAQEHVAHSDTGYYALNWNIESEGDAAFVLEESSTADFEKTRRIYEGRDRSTTFSGRMNGAYHYRVRVGDGLWSQPLTMIVQHRSLAEATVYLGVGAVVFLATAVLVITGHLAHRREGRTR